MLMQSGIRAKNGEIVDARVSRESTEACDDCVIPNLTVMPDMRAVHDIVVIADSRASTAIRSPDVDRDLFSNLCACTNLESRRFAIERLILWFSAKACVWEDSTVFPNDRATEERDVSADLDTASEFHPLPDKRKRADDRIGRQNRAIFDACRRVDLRQGV
jgi:hypothetical protein